MLLNYPIGRLALSSLCVGDLVRLGLSGARVTCFSSGFTVDSRNILEISSWILHPYGKTSETKYPMM